MKPSLAVPLAAVLALVAGVAPAGAQCGTGAIQKLTASDAGPFDNFGSAITLSRMT